jgi:hypothetical protein
MRDVLSNSANYTSTLACTGTSGLSGTTLTVGAADTAITCTQTNTRKSTTFRLAKAWSANSTAGNVASIGATTGLTNNTALFTSTASTNTNGTAITVFAGETATLPAETMTTGTLANYTTTVSCNAGTLTGTNGQSTGNTLAVTAASTATSPITCTYTNTPKTATLQLAKAWGANSLASDSASIGATTGGTNNTSSFSTAGGTSANSGAAVTVTVGNTITFPAETGTNIGNYNTVLSCLAGGGATANSLSGTNGQVSNSLVIGAGDSGKAIVCSYTNTRKSATITLRKTWVNALVNDAVSVTATGLTSLASVANTANETDTAAVQTVYAGDAITIGETFTTGSAANYTRVLSCSGNTNALAANVLTVNAADTAIVCTQTNSLILPTLTVTKLTQGGTGSFTFTGDNGWLSQNITTVAIGAGVAGATQTLAVANTVTTISETLASGFTLTGVSCTGMGAGGVVTPNLALAAFSLNAAATAATSNIACTVTNSKTPTVKVQKITVGGFGGPFSFSQTNLASAPASISTVAANTATPAAPTAINITTIGTAITLTETPASGYSLTAASCTDANSAVTGNSGNIGTLTGNVLTIPAANVTAGSDYSCSFTNSKVSYVNISGRVFNDNSGSTGVAANAYNGIQDAGENGISNSLMRLTDCGSNVLATTSTNADGDYSFQYPQTTLPNPFCIVENNITGYTSVSGTAGYTRTTDSINVINTNATSYTGRNFGDANLNLVLFENGQQTTIPGGAVDYPHHLIANSVLTINNLNQVISQQPVNTSDQPWQNLIYLDSNCNGVVDAGETLFKPSASPLNLLPNQNPQICLVQRVYAPTNASAGAQNIGQLSASYSATLQDSSLNTGTSNIVKDTTLIGSAGLSMSKQVRVVASCPSTAADIASFVTQNQAISSNYLEYEITYTNNSARNLVDVAIKDTVPLGTTYQSMVCSVTPMTSCVASQSSGVLVWQTTGVLLPARQGKVRFCVQVQ